MSDVYRLFFWTGYLAVLTTSFITLDGVSLDKIKIGPEVFRIRLDFLLHFVVYLLICMYYLAGRWKDLSLFASNPLIKFILLLLFLAIVTELIQIWVPERAFNVFDLVANVAGIVVGVGVIRRVEG